MTAITLFTRVDCHLCEDAKAVLDEVRLELPFALEIVNIDTSPALVEAYGLEVPVVLIDGRKAFKFRVDATVLRARLARSGAV